MKISRTILSNIATFPYIADMHTAEGVLFSLKDTGSIHIFIGPNGSGKSTFLDIIQQICSSVLFLPYECDLERVTEVSHETMRDIIRYTPIPIHNLHENKTGKGKPSVAFITFDLNEQDHKNLSFIYTHQKELNELITTYSTSSFRFDYTQLEHYIGSYEQITCKVQIDTTSNTAWLLQQHVEQIEKFIFDYFTHFHLIQHCIAIHNVIQKDDVRRSSLRATFAMIGSYRDLANYNETYTIGHDDYSRLMSSIQDTTQSSIKMAQDHVIGLLYVKKKIAKFLYKKNPHASAFEIEDYLKQLDVFQHIQFFCQKYLHRRMVVAPDQYVQSRYRFTLMDDVGNESYLDDLSAGEKSMLGIIAAVYGFGLNQGLLVIDEPELHLHPQLQKQFLKLIEALVLKFGLQCIMTTHSSLMIHDKNIRNVYRFHTEKGVTHIITPGELYNEDTSKLMQILKFTNTAKIFFVKKIIMVEGETDEYAFGYYLQHLIDTDPTWEKIIKDYEIVNINGKGGYTRWKKFLRTFGIKSYFIGDRDNIQDTGSQSINMHYYEKKAMRHTHKGYLSKSEKYQAIISYLQAYEPAHWDDISAMIQQLYKKNIFILQQGDIEAYLGMQEKGLEETVQFFHHDFSQWIGNLHFAKQREELHTIFRAIFTDE